MAALTAISMPVLVCNAGSSSLKASVLGPPDREVVAAAEAPLGADATRDADPTQAMADVLDELRLAGVERSDLTAVGHRVVHGGRRFTAPVVVDDDVLAAIDDLASLAPLHNVVAAATIRAARTALPDARHVAVFDTAFHAVLPADAVTYAVPPTWRDTWGVRRYGFHGLAVSWVARRTAELLQAPEDGLGLVVAHLGSGCSVTAVEGGRSVDTSMGMTPLEGLVMGTRSGSIDPGILLALLREERLDVAELAEALDHRSGLLGLSGRSADVRELLAAEARGDAAATLALAVFVRRAAAAIGAAATTLGRLDGLAFSGGIGEHSSAIRGRIVARLGTLGVPSLHDEPAEADAGSTSHDRVLARASDGPAVVRVAAREDVVIAEAVVATLE